MDRQRFIIVVLVLILIGGIYYYYQVYSIAPSVEVMNPEIIELDSRLVAIRSLNSVEFDTSVLDNPFFLSLKPIVATTSTSPAVIAGRINPFLPF